MPFCTTSWALPTSRATAMDASKLCGSVFGLDMMALAWTYLPPTWPITSAYWLSAPTATILPPPGAAVAPPDHGGGDRRDDRRHHGEQEDRHGTPPGGAPCRGTARVSPACAAAHAHAPCPFATPGHIVARFDVNDNRFYYQ